MKSRRSVAYVSLVDASFISILKRAVQIAPKIWDSNQIYTKIGGPTNQIHLGNNKTTLLR